MKKAKALAYRNGKIPGRNGYGIDDNELKCLFYSGITILEIAAKMNISQWTVLKHLKKFGLRRHHVPYIIERHDIFSIANVQNSYWAGFLAADGWIPSSRNGVDVELSAIDTEHLKALCRFVGREEALYFRERYNEKGKVFKYASLHLRSAKMAEDLSKVFCVTRRKSLTLEPPKDLSQSLRRHFIRGYFDGDGSVGWHKHNKTVRLNIASGSRVFLEWIWKIMREELGYLGLRTVCSREDSEVKTLSLTGDPAVKVLDWMYDGAEKGFYLERKFCTFKRNKKRLEEKRAEHISRRENLVSELISLYNQGLSYRDISRKLGITKEKVSYYLKRTDIVKRRRNNQNLAGQRIKARDKEMLLAHNVGETINSLSIRFGIAESSVKVALYRAKLESKA